MLHMPKVIHEALTELGQSEGYDLVTFIKVIIVERGMMAVAENLPEDTDIHDLLKPVMD